MKLPYPHTVPAFIGATLYTADQLNALGPDYEFEDAGHAVTGSVPAKDLSVDDIMALAAKHGLTLAPPVFGDHDNDGKSGGAAPPVEGAPDDDIGKMTKAALIVELGNRDASFDPKATAEDLRAQLRKLTAAK